MLTQKMIDEAINGNETALQDIRNHYDSFLKTLCREYLKLPCGEEIRTVNTEMEGEITTHLFIQIIRLGEKNGKDTFEYK